MAGNLPIRLNSKTYSKKTIEIATIGMLVESGTILSISDNSRNYLKNGSTISNRAETPTLPSEVLVILSWLDSREVELNTQRDIKILYLKFTLLWTSLEECNKVED